MKLYGVLYEDHQGEGGKGIDEVLYTTIDAASAVAQANADGCVEELNAVGDDEYGPYRVQPTHQGNGLPVFDIFGSGKGELESFSVVEFTVDV